MERRGPPSDTLDPSWVNVGGQTVQVEVWQVGREGGWGGSGQGGLFELRVSREVAVSDDEECRAAWCEKEGEEDGEGEGYCKGVVQHSDDHAGRLSLAMRLRRIAAVSKRLEEDVPWDSKSDPCHHPLDTLQDVQNRPDDSDSQRDERIAARVGCFCAGHVERECPSATTELNVYKPPERSAPI